MFTPSDLDLWPSDLEITLSVKFERSIVFRFRVISWQGTDIQTGVTDNAASYSRGQHKNANCDKLAIKVTRLLQHSHSYCVPTCYLFMEHVTRHWSHGLQQAALQEPQPERSTSSKIHGSSYKRYWTRTLIYADYISSGSNNENVPAINATDFAPVHQAPRS